MGLDLTLKNVKRKKKSIVELQSLELAGPKLYRVLVVCQAALTCDDC